MFNLSPRLKTFEVSVAPGSTFGGENLVNLAEVVAPNAVAISTMITNFGSGPVTVRFDGDEDSDFTLEASTSTQFHANDVHAVSYDFSASISGSGSELVEIQCGVVLA